MIDQLRGSIRTKKLQVGNFFKLNSETFVICTEIFDNEEKLLNRTRKLQLTQSDSFKILTFKKYFFSSKQYVGLLNTERIEEAALLKQMHDKLLVKFKGDYRTKRFPVDRFEEADDKYLLTRNKNNMAGIYHETSGTFLKVPKLQGDSIEQKENITIENSQFRYIMIHTPKYSYPNSNTSSENRPRSTSKSFLNQIMFRTFNMLGLRK